MYARTNRTRIAFRLAGLAALASGLASCFAAPVPVIAKGERLPFQGQLACRIDSAEAPPTLRMIDTAQATVAADGGVSYADGDKTLTVRKAPSGLWLLQYGKAGRYDYGYAKVSGDVATIHVINLYGYAEGDLAEHHVRAVPAGNGVQLVGADRAVEAFLLSRREEELFESGRCKGGTAGIEDVRLLGPFRRSTTRDQALGYPGTRECDGKVCYKAVLGDTAVEAEGTFADDGTLRRLSYRMDMVPVPPSERTPFAQGDMGVVAGAGLQQVGLVVDGQAANLTTPEWISPGLVSKLTALQNGKGAFLGALKRGDVKRLDMVGVDPLTRSLVKSQPTIGGYIQTALATGGVTVQTSMTTNKEGTVVLQGVVSQMRAR